MAEDVSAVRADFPVLDRDVGDRDLVYLDNAATTQTPEQVRAAWDAVHREYNANVHRGIHQLSYEASVAYEEAHDRLAEFVGADGRQELIFTKNTTEAINLVAQAWGLDHLEQGDAVVLTEMEHHASLVTWQQIAEQVGAELRYVGVTDDGRLDMAEARRLVDDDAAVLSVTHVSNVLGTVNPVGELADLAHDHGARIVVDGAQAVPTRPVDVQAIDADFYAFSGHKMLGPTGVGGLYGKRHLLEEMDPFLYGGGMIRHVTKERATWNELPWKFEAGTPPIAEAVALAEAADYLDAIGMERVREHENDLAQYMLERLAAREDVETYGPPPGVERTGLVAFNVDGVHAHDLSSVLDRQGIAIRAGDHCTQPLHDCLGLAGTARASVYVYNTREEVDALLEGLDGAREAVEDYLAGDPWGETIHAHHRDPHREGGLADPDVRKDSAETSCGDEGEFHLEIEDGVVTAAAFESDACAVSRATASVLADHVEGRSLEEIAALDGDVLDLLDEGVDPLRLDCVRGPEEVLRVAAAEQLDAPEPRPAE